MGADLIASELTWDNFFLRYSEETKTPLKLGPIPTLNPQESGQYLKPSMLLSASARTEHAEQAAQLIDFLINDPEVGKIFGGNRGIPASTSQREAGEFEGPTLAVAQFEDTVADKLGKAPPAPPKGAGTLEAEFLRLGEELDYQRMSVQQAVDEFFTKADEVLGS
jgi:multiple sugar transport system substrate-binding protein